MGHSFVGTVVHADGYPGFNGLFGKDKADTQKSPPNPLWSRRSAMSLAGCLRRGFISETVI